MRYFLILFLCVCIFVASSKPTTKKAGDAHSKKVKSVEKQLHYEYPGGPPRANTPPPGPPKYNGSEQQSVKALVPSQISGTNKIVFDYQPAKRK